MIGGLVWLGNEFSRRYGRPAELLADHFGSVNQRGDQR